MFTDGVIQYYTSPLSRSELGLADVCNLPWLSATDPYALSDYETISVLCQYDTVIWNKKFQLFYNESDGDNLLK